MNQTILPTVALLVATALLASPAAAQTSAKTQKIAATGPMIELNIYRAADLAKYRKPAAKELKVKLTPLQYSVTQENDTETPFNNQYWNNEAPGIYVDIVSGEPLFSSLDKFHSGTGWPSFTKPLVAENLTTITDKSAGMVRVEVRSRHADSHLGHLFPDGPKPTGMRYCMNSASLRFIPASELKRLGYGEFASLFEAPGK